MGRTPTVQCIVFGIPFELAVAADHGPILERTLGEKVDETGVLLSRRQGRKKNQGKQGSKHGGWGQRG